MAYNPIVNYGVTPPVFYNSHNTSTTPYTPAYGQFIIEAIESKLSGSVQPQAGDSFVVDGASVQWDRIGL